MRHTDRDDYARDMPCAVLATLYGQHLHISPSCKPPKAEGAEITGLESEEQKYTTHPLKDQYPHYESKVQNSEDQ